MWRILTAALLLSGCASGPPAEAQGFGACIVGGLPKGGKYYALRELTVSGTVMDRGTGVPADCQDVVWSSGPRREAGEGWWIELADGKDVVRVAIWLTDGPEPPAIDAEVRLSASLRFGGFGPSAGQVSLRDDTAGRDLWLGMAGTVEALPNAPIGLAQGEQVGRDGGECGRWGYHDLLADDTVVPYGARAEVGEHTVWHGGIAQQTGSNTNCLDWFVAQAAVAVFTP